MRDLLIEIWESVRRNKLRTCLTGLAVSWGIFMLIVLLGAGNGVLNTFLGDMEGMEKNRMTVYAGWTSKPYDGMKEGRRTKLTDNELALTAGPAFADHIDEVSSVYHKGSLTMASGKKHFTVRLNGVYPHYSAVRGMRMEAGRFINGADMQQKRKAAVITHLQARSLLGGSKDYSRILGRRVKIGDISYTVVGVRHGRENEMDSEVYAPYSTIRAIYSSSTNELSQIEFSFHGLETEKENEEFEKRYRAVINKSRRAAPDDESALWISNHFTRDLKMSKALRILKTSLWVLGLLTLLGGIVGVSNIMLITVKERTREFGIRKAIGAGPWSIMKLIVSESVAITAVFGYVGMILGLVACEVLDATVGQNSLSLMGESIKVMTDPSVGVGTAIGVTAVLIVAGTLAGMIPASKAAKVRPIEALNAD